MEPVPIYLVLILLPASLSAAVAALSLIIGAGQDEGVLDADDATPWPIGLFALFWVGVLAIGLYVLISCAEKNAVKE